MATRRQDYDYLIKLLLIGDSGRQPSLNHQEDDCIVVEFLLVSNAASIMARKVGQWDEYIAPASNPDARRQHTFHLSPAGLPPSLTTSIICRCWQELPAFEVLRRFLHIQLYYDHWVRLLLERVCFGHANALTGAINLWLLAELTSRSKRFFWTTNG